MNFFTVNDFREVLPASTRMVGDTTKTFNGFKPVSECDKQSLSWIRVDAKKKAELINGTNAGAVVCDAETHALYTGNGNDILFIISETPKTVFYKILSHLCANDRGDGKVHPTAIVHPDCKLGKNVTIGAYSVIGACSIGDNTVIQEYVKIFDPVTIGSNCLVREFCSIGGAGFGIVKDDEGNNLHVPHVGTVVIKDSVMILPFSNVDRGTLGQTVIDEFTCVDHYCHIGHNTKTGKNNILTAGVIMAGGSQIGNDCFIGVRTTVKEKVIIGSGVTTGMASNIISNVPDKETWIGNPAMEMSAFQKWRKYIKEKISTS
jgi:UDP-3-O-[3-hydroxymyristoyl] glucosamine N-acyltransferase